MEYAIYLKGPDGTRRVSGWFATYQEAADEYRKYMAIQDRASIGVFFIDMR